MFFSVEASAHSPRVLHPERDRRQDIKFDDLVVPWRGEGAWTSITFLLTELDKELGSPENVQYLHVSVNSKLDTAEQILLHFEKHDIDVEREPRWLFANASEGGIRKLLGETDVEMNRTEFNEVILTEQTMRVFIVCPKGEAVASFENCFRKRE